MVKNCTLAKKQQMNSVNELVHIKPPVTFNPHKHHLGFLKKQIKTWQTLPWEEVEKELLPIGTNLSDLYCGALSVEEICRQCLQFALQQNLTSAQKLKNWLSPKEFRKTAFSDGSEWVIKLGQNPESYLHIHPAKYADFTVRVRGTTLKTVVALKISAIPKKEGRLTLQQVNRIRREKLALSPIKNLEKGKGIQRIWSLFNLP